MEGMFDIPVRFKGEDLLFPAQLLHTGYSHRFQVDVYGQHVFFEPDEEKNYRAIIEPENLTKHLTVDLLKAIAEAIEEILR